MQPQSGGAGFKPPSNKSPLIIGLLAVLFIAAAGFGFWAFTGRQDYKNNTDAKIATAVTAAKSAEDTKQQQIYNEELKKPYKSYSGLATLGSVSFNYPLTYSAYIDTTNNSQPIEGYFYPNVVPGISGNTSFALRVELKDSAYSDTLNQFSSDIQSGKITSVAYIPPKMKGVSNVQPGVLLTGPLSNDQQGNPQNGIMLIIPVRDETLQMYTQSTDYSSDFNNIVLPSVTFAP